MSNRTQVLHRSMPRLSSEKRDRARYGRGQPTRLEETGKELACRDIPPGAGENKKARPGDTRTGKSARSARSGRSGWGRASDGFLELAQAVEILCQSLHLGIAGVSLPILDAQDGVVGNLGVPGNAGQFTA